MFNFDKIKMIPCSPSGFKPQATKIQIEELERYCGHSLPENYKTILKNYNYGRPTANYFNVIDSTNNLTVEWELNKFYSLDKNKDSPANIWWCIKNYSSYMGPNTLPFANDICKQIFYMKWVDNIPQVWFLEYLDIKESKTYLIKKSFDELLSSLYAED